MDHNTYDVEDFASDESFIKWVTNPDNVTDEFWRVFALTHPELTPKLDKARALVSNLRRAEITQHDQKKIDFIWQNIHARVGASPTAVPKSPSRVLKFALIAVGALSLITLTLWYVTDTNPSSDLERYSHQVAMSGFFEQVNETGSPVNIQIEDGSTICLENNGRLKYKNAYDTDSTRDVYLLGEAFFEVTKNPFKPFVVHANGVITEVLGTSFRVQANSDETNVVVSVRTGKVSVYAPQKTAVSGNKVNGVILLPNQEVRYEREQQSFNKKLVEVPQILPLAADERNFVFENAPLKDVFKSLQDAYGIEILYNGEAMKNCFITAPLGSESLFEKLKIICQTIGATYEIIDAKVVINSNGC